jgi:hypothetical protein
MTRLRVPTNLICVEDGGHGANAPFAHPTDRAAGTINPTPNYRLVQLSPSPCAAAFLRYFSVAGAVRKIRRE